MRYEVVLYINSQHSLFDYAKVYTGLDALARRALIGLRVRIREEVPTNLVLAHVTTPDAKSRRLLGFDLYDRSTFLCPVGLEHCDLYFKRSLYRPDTTGLPPEQRAKILPFGLNYPCESEGSRLWVLRTWTWGRR